MEEKSEEVDASIVSEVSHVDVYLVGEIHLQMIQKGLGDIVKHVMQLSIVLAEEYVDLTQTGMIMETEIQIKFDVNAKEIFMEIIVKSMVK